MRKKQQRRDALLKLVAEEGYLSLSEIAKSLDVSEQTIRRDFQALEEQPNIRRTHGGITLVQPIAKGDYSKRLRIASSEKTSVALKAANFVKDGASVFLDHGTTSEAAAEALLARRNLRVTTYSIRIAAHFLDRDDITVAIPGGIVRQEDGAIVGPHNDDFMKQFRFDYAIIAVSGLDDSGRLADNDLFEVKRVQAAMQQADKSILMLTSDKIGVKSLFELCHLSEIDLLAASAPATAALDGLLTTSGIKLI